ncbi:MAG: 2-hydroxyacyl-CoA dehydratase [Deltaproteobacteria bacterium]|nr:2-hydroxyacyl-CoA dehydratase [Deltaproteobacteria bacterium]
MEDNRLNNQKIAQVRKAYTKGYYERIREAKRTGRPVAYTTALGPTELLYAMGVEVCMPENYVTICCAKQMAKGFCEEAEKRSISPDLCSYVRCGLGMMYREDGPMGALPAPDFIVGVVSACDPHAKWWELKARHYNVPLFLIDAPFSFRGDVPPHYTARMVFELKRLADFVEEHTGRPFVEDDFRECVRLSGEAHAAFSEIQDLRKHVPAPRGMREMVGDLFYLITQTGRKESVDYYRMVLEETRQRVAEGEGVVDHEKIRLYFHNIPLWFNLQTIDWLADQGAVVAMDFYTNHVWHGFFFDGGRFDSGDPFEDLARKWLFFDNHVGLPVKLSRSLRSAREWGCQGAIFFSNRSCKVYSIGQPEQIGALEQELGIRSFTFEAEMADPRSFSMDRWKEHVDMFLEFLSDARR